MRIKIIADRYDPWIKIIDTDNNDNILYDGTQTIPVNTLAELFETIAPDLEQVIIEEN